MNLTAMFNSGARFLKNNSSNILLVLGVVNAGVAIYKAVTATPKALTLLDEAAQAKLDLDAPPKIEDLPKMFTPKEVVSTTWRCYVSPAVHAALSIACFVGASHVNSVQKAVLSAACVMSENALKEYVDANVATIGPAKEREVHDTVAKKRVAETPPSEVIVINNGGSEYPCLDTITNQYFKSNYDTVMRKIEKLNRSLREDMLVTVGEYCDELEINRPAKCISDRIAWDVANGYIEPCISTTSLDDHTPVLVIGHYTFPRAIR